jgi:hypothetical protein
MADGAAHLCDDPALTVATRSIYLATRGIRIGRRNEDLLGKKICLGEVK